jgi:hypothetical protein
MKKILLVQYSQTGQLTGIAKAFSAPLQSSPDVELTIETLKPQQPYPYPWPFFDFLDVFPECVLLDPPPIEPLEIDPQAEFDLVVIAYQVWFLAPSLPVTAFMLSNEAKRLLKDKPVITLIGCRNMWSRAQETMKGLISDCGGRLLDNVVLIDQGSALASFITTPRWLLSGKKEAFWGFPPAGVSDPAITDCCRFGEALTEALAQDLEKGDQPLLHGLQAVEADMSQIQSEKAGHRSFMIWGKLLHSIGRQGDPRRKPVLMLYLVFLILMIIAVVPLSMLLKALLAPLMQKRHAEAKSYYEAPSGSGDERMKLFDCGK